MEKDNIHLEENRPKQRNYTPFIWVLTIIMVAIILGVNYIPRSTTGTIAGFDVKILPLINAILNGIAFVFLVISLVFIKRKNVNAHHRFIYAAFGTTFLFLISYLTYHAMAGSTSYGGDGVLMYIYYFILITHIILAAILLPLAMITLARGLNMDVPKHRKIEICIMTIWHFICIS